MPNQFETSNSDLGITIHLKMNGERLDEQMALGSLFLTIFDFSFLYLAYEAYTDKNDLTFFGLILLLAFFIYIIYLHYDYRQCKRWIKHADETFFISKNNLSISKKCLNQNLLTIDIDTQKSSKFLTILGLEVHILLTCLIIPKVIFTFIHQMVTIHLE